jgi:hypothetical protein
MLIPERFFPDDCSVNCGNVILDIKWICDRQLPGDFIPDRYSAFFGVCRAGLSQQRNSSCLALSFWSTYRHFICRKSPVIITPEKKSLRREQKAMTLVVVRMRSCKSQVHVSFASSLFLYARTHMNVSIVWLMSLVCF